jgi:hypothetical protein
MCKLQYGARYGHIMTGQELFCVRRPGGHGVLEVTEPIAWGVYHVQQ